MSWEHKPITQWALELLNIRPQDHVLDVGCGGGMALKLAASEAVDGRVVGVDYSPEMVAQAQRRNRKRVKAGRVEVQPGRVEDLPFDNEVFDKILAIETFYFWPNPESSLRELRRVLRPGGALGLVLEASRESPNLESVEEGARAMHYELYSGEQVTDLLRSAGYADAWFEVEADKGRGWLCVVGTK